MIYSIQSAKEEITKRFTRRKRLSSTRPTRRYPISADLDRFFLSLVLQCQTNRREAIFNALLQRLTTLLHSFSSPTLASFASNDELIRGRALVVTRSSWPMSKKGAVEHYFEQQGNSGNTFEKDCWFWKHVRGSIFVSFFSHAEWRKRNCSIPTLG